MWYPPHCLARSLLEGPRTAFQGGAFLSRHLPHVIDIFDMFSAILGAVLLAQLNNDASPFFEPLTQINTKSSLIWLTSTSLLAFLEMSMVHTP
jgi:hypothetical protein